MGSYTYPVVNGTRTLTETQLSEFSAKLLLSGRDFLRDSESVFYLLAGGRILASDVGFEPGRRLHELYQPSFDTNYPLSIAWNHKSLSQIRSTSQALQDQGFTAITSLVEGNMLLWDSTLPRSKFQTVIEDNSTLQILQKRHTTNNNKQTFSDFSAQDVWIQKLSRLYQTINNTYSTSLSINGTPITNLQLQGLYLEIVSGSTYRIGVTSQRPTITLVNGSSISVEAGSVWSEPGASAVDEDGTAVQVTITGDTVNTSQLTGGTPYQLVYTAVSNNGDRNSSVRQVHCIDTTAVTIVLLPHSSGSIHPTLDTGTTWVDPGYTALADGPWETITHSQSGTVSVNTPGSYPLVVTATDGTQSATITRTVTVQDPAFFTSSGPFTGHLLSTNFFGTALTSEQDQLGLGTNYGIQVKFSYLRTTDPQGVIVALLDSSSYANNFHYEGPDSRACLAWRIDQTSGIIARLQQSHPSWGSNRYMGDCQGITIPNQTSYTEVTTRIWDDGSNWKLFIGAGSNSAVKTMAKTGTALFVMPRTSSFSGVCFNCVEINGSVTTSQGWLVNGGSVKDISLSALNPAANHSVP